ncbi:MAG: hypothetical protein RL033_1146 [Pseudomonadota bacterium]
MLLGSGVLRLWLALEDHSIYWPDELYQSLEQAHRLTFGSGLIPWEFRDGARNWILPGLLAGLWKLAALLGVSSSLTLVALARGAVVLASLAAAWLSARLATRLASPRAGFVAALILGALPASVVFGYRTMSESVSAPLVVLSALLLFERSARRAVLSGIWITLATLLRYQNALFGVVSLLWLLRQRRLREAALFTAAGLTTLLAGGALDWLSWGRPFHSLLAYVDFNLLRGGASTFGVEPFWYYAQSLWTSSGPALIGLTALAMVGGLRAPVLSLAVLLDLLVHSCIPHKELRFLVPALPLLGVLVGLGADRLFPRRTVARVGWALAVAASALGLLLELPQLTYRELGQYLDVPRGTRRIWHADEEPNLLLAHAGQRADLCGLGVLGLRPAFTGAYTYLHRSVPLFYGRQTCGAEAALNYLLVPYYLADSLLPAGYQQVESLGWLGLFRREGGCEAMTFDPLLDGAHNMGLRRPTAARAQDGGLRFDLLRDSGNFVSGWSIGELIECGTARWAVGRKSTVRFQGAATSHANVLRARLRAHPAAHEQHLVASLNGEVIFAGEVPTERWRLTADTPALLPGSNELSFEWSETSEPEGDDTRELAALFDSLELAPLGHDFSLHAGGPGDAEHWVEGFSHAELEGNEAFVWSEGSHSVVQGRLDQPELPHLLSFTAQSIRGNSGLVHLSINGQPLRTLELSPEWSEQAVIVPSQLLRAGLNRVRFDYDETVAPAILYATSSDWRELSARFRTFSLTPLPERSVIDVGSPEARPALLDGWSGEEREDERSVAWTSGPRARLQAWLAGPKDARLSIETRAYGAALPLAVEVLLEGHGIGVFHPGASWQSHELTLPARFFAAGQSVIELRFDRTARPQDHEPGSLDSRELALRVDRVLITR